MSYLVAGNYMDMLCYSNSKQEMFYSNRQKDLIR